MPMKFGWFRKFGVRPLAGGILAGGILHICTTLAIPYTSTTAAYRSLKTSLPKNQMMILPPASAENQLLPYMTPEIRIAICRYDISREPVQITANLLDPSWTLALYTPQGDNFYIATGSPNRPLKVSFDLVPPAERFLGIFKTSQSVASDKQQVEVPDKQGVVIIRAPINGTAFAQEVETALRLSNCRPDPQ